MNRIFSSPRFPSRRRLVTGRSWWGGVGAAVILSLSVWSVSAQSLSDALGRGEDAAAERETAELLAPLDEPDDLRPDQRAAKAFGPPPDAKKLFPKPNLWIDVKRKRVYLDGYVAIREGQLEMFACPAGTKEHESVVAVLARSSEVHPALLAVGAREGTPVDWGKTPEDFVPPTGQRIRIWVTYRDPEGKFRVADAKSWIKHLQTGKAMSDDWVFAGSDFWTDPADGKEYYQADGGDMICVSNFSTAMLDVPFASSASADSLLFVPFSERVPTPGTPVRLVLVPIPDPSDQPESKPDPNVQPDQPPTERILPPYVPQEAAPDQPVPGKPVDADPRVEAKATSEPGKATHRNDSLSLGNG